MTDIFFQRLWIPYVCAEFACAFLCLLMYILLACSERLTRGQLHKVSLDGGLNGWMVGWMMSYMVV